MSETETEGDLDLARARLQARVEELEALITRSSDARIRRVLELEEQVRDLNEMVEEKGREIETLRLENERLKVDVSSVVTEQLEERLLPARQEAEEQIEALRGQVSHYELALETQNNQLTKAMEKLDLVEEQRDERDGMLREEERRRQNAEAQARQASLNAAKYRLSYLRTNDPGKGEQGSHHQAKTRILAWLGNFAARAELGLADNVCPLCRASPACVMAKTPHLHGTILPQEVMDYLRTVVAHSVENNRDATAALESWASGGDWLGGDA